MPKLTLTTSRGLALTIAAILHLLWWTPSVTLAKPADPAQSPGLVAEQPASGPFVKTDRGFMVPYTETIPGTERHVRNDARSPAASSCSAAPTAKLIAATTKDRKSASASRPSGSASAKSPGPSTRRTWQMYDVFKKLQRLAATPADDASRSDANDDWKLVDEHAWQGDLEEEWGVDAVTTRHAALRCQLHLRRRARSRISRP